jgi:hypothetical protein
MQLKIIPGVAHHQHIPGVVHANQPPEKLGGPNPAGERDQHDLPSDRP